MGKICAVENCDSGTYRQVKRRKDLGLRPLSLFIVPKCLNERRTWGEIIGCALNNKEYLCELHFDDRDIRKVNKAGGIKPYYTLKKDAKPIAINNNQREMNEPEIMATMDVVLRPAEESVEFILPDALNDIISTESEYCSFGDHLLTNSKQSAMNNEVLTIKKPVVSGADVFSVNDIAQHFDSHPLPRTWGWMMNPRQADSLVFTQLDPATGNIRLRLDVDSELSLKLRTPDDKVNQDIDLKVHSIRDLETMLQRMEITPMCSGTGFEGESRSEHCQGFIDVDDYAVNVREKRCPACRRLRVTLQNRANRKKAQSVNTRYERSKYLRHLQRQKMRRLQRRLALLINRTTMSAPTTSSAPTIGLVQPKSYRRIPQQPQRPDRHLRILHRSI